MSKHLDDLMSERSKLKNENKSLRDLCENTRFEKEDEKALIIAGLTTILPVALIGCLLFYLVMWTIFMR